MGRRLRFRQKNGRIRQSNRRADPSEKHKKQGKGGENLWLVFCIHYLACEIRLCYNDRESENMRSNFRGNERMVPHIKVHLSDVRFCWVIY